MLVRHYRKLLSFKIISLFIGICGLTLSLIQLQQQKQNLTTNILLIDTPSQSGTIISVLTTLYANDPQGQIAIIAGSPQAGWLLPTTQRQATTIPQTLKLIDLFADRVSLIDLQAFATKQIQPGDQIWYIENNKLKQFYTSSTIGWKLPQSNNEVVLLIAILLIILGL